MVNKWSENKLFQVFQSPCLLCGRDGVDGKALCRSCQNELPYSGLSNTCMGCALPIQSSSVKVHDQYCGRCQSCVPLWTNCVSSFDYIGPVSWMIQALKFNRQLSIAPLLGGLMAESIVGRRCSKPDLIIPVPLHRSRLRERGFNQALELARPIAISLGVPLDYQSIFRLKASVEQSSLSAGLRMANVKGIFKCRGRNRVKHVAIVDDVMTTASTVHELSRVLLESGVEKIQVWVCARAMINKDSGFI